MEPLNGVEALARVARSETAPQTDIRIAPLVRAFRVEQRWRLTPLAWSAGFSAMAACAVLFFALHQNQTASVDSIAPLFSAAQVQMP